MNLTNYENGVAIVKRLRTTGLEEVNTHPPVIRKRQIVGLLFADDLTVGATTTIGLQRAINCIKDCCDEWSLNMNETKTKIVVFKKGGKLSRDKKWRLVGEQIETVKEIKYLGVVMDNRGTWDKERKQVAIRGKSALISINICMVRTPNIEVKVLEQVYNALLESRMMTGVEIWGLEDGWKEIKKVHELFCKRVMGTPNTAANGAYVKELGRTNRKEKVIETVLTYWQRLRQMDEMSLLGVALKQQSLEKGKNWLNKMKQELEGLGMGDIWIMGEENNRNVWRKVSKRCMDIER
jgi:hypothetical protein